MKRARRWALVLAGPGSLLFSAACGGASITPGTDAAPEPADATADGDPVNEGSARQDGAADTSEADAAVPLICQFDAALLTEIQPDAALSDSGIAECLQCIEGTCKSEVDACLGDCTCKMNAASLVECVAGGANITTCLAGLLSSGSAATGTLLGCLVSSACPAACGL